MSVLNLLSGMDMFRGLAADDLQMLPSVLRRKDLPAFAPLYRQNEPADRCYLVVEGKLGLYLGLPGGGEERIAVVDKGAVVGHLELIDGGRRSHSCRAVIDDVVLLELDREVFDRLFRAESPFAYKVLDRIAMDVAGRLRAVTQHLVTLPPGHKVPKKTARESLASLASTDGVSFVGAPGAKKH